MTSSSRLTLAALLVASALQAALWFLPPGPGLRARVFEPISDAPEYEELAASLAARSEFSREAGGVYRPELFRTPGYPLLLAGLRLIFGSSPAAILGLQLLLSLLTLLALKRLALDSGLSDRAAGLAVLLLAASPNLAFHATKAVTETAFTLLLTICLLLMARYRRYGLLRDIAGAGIAAGLLMLFRPIAAWWPLPIGAWVAWRCIRAGRKTPVAGAAGGRARGVQRRFPVPWPALVPVLAALLVAGPWVLRNYRTFGRPVLSTAAERNLYLYNAATVIAADKELTLDQARDLMQAEARERFGPLDSNDEAGYWRHLGIIGREHLLRRPLRAVMVQLAGFAANYVVPASVSPLLAHSGAASSGEFNVMQRALGLATRGRLAAAWQTARQGRLEQAGTFFWAWFGLSALHLALLLALAAAGLGRARRYRPGWYPGSAARAPGTATPGTPGPVSVAWLLLPVLYFTLLTGPVGEPRFRAPVEPALAVLAAAALVRRPSGPAAEKQESRPRRDS